MHLEAWQSVAEPCLKTCGLQMSSSQTKNARNNRKKYLKNSLNLPTHTGGGGEFVMDRIMRKRSLKPM